MDELLLSHQCRAGETLSSCGAVKEGSDLISCDLDTVMLIVMPRLHISYLLVQDVPTLGQECSESRGHD